MLQQTQTSKVLEYFDRFMKRFPSVNALAAARLDDVLKAWEGLGYYARARNLHQAAKFLADHLNGKFPRVYQELLEIPGIGPYTAAAVASIAFNQDRAVVDGNVERVLSRLFVIEEFPRSSSGKRTFQHAADGFLLPGTARHWNQALMELGALICLPRRPRCAICPAKRYCKALHILREPDRLPIRKPKTARPHHDLVVGLIWKNGRVLIDQRKPDGLLGGLWEFPGGKIENGESHEQALRREALEALAIEVEVRRPVMQVRHSYTHFSVTLHVYHCHHLAGRARPLKGQASERPTDGRPCSPKGRPAAIGCQKCKWVFPSQLGSYAFPTANRRIINALMPQDGTHE